MMQRWRRAAGKLSPVLLGFALMAVWSGAGAQSTRDPTQRPAAASSAPATSATARAVASDAAAAVIVRDGQPYLVVGTRLVAQGQMFGEARIERITETEVWLREGKALRKVPVFNGIVRKAAATSAAVRDCAAPDPKKSRPSARIPSPAEICPP